MPIDEFFATSYVYLNSSVSYVRDLSSLKEFNTAAYTFPDICFAIEDIVAEGDKVVYRYSARGTHKGKFTTTAPTGKQVIFKGIVISRIANGSLRRLGKHGRNICIAVARRSSHDLDERTNKHQLRKSQRNSDN
jgi:predicted ester cyclase